MIAKHLKYGLMVLALGGGLSIESTAGSEPLDNCPSVLRMADTGIEGMGNLHDAFGPFAKRFETITGIELQLFSLSNRTAAGNALIYGDVDLVFAGPSEYLLFRRETGVDILFTVERPHYGSSFFVPADSEIHSLEDLRGKRVALKDVGSASGHLLPILMLRKAGLDPKRDLDIIMAGDSRAAALANGDVAAMGGGNRDLQLLRQMDPDGEYRVIAESPLLPGDPVLVRASLPHDCRTQLADRLEAHADALWEALVATDRNHEKFVQRDSALRFDRSALDYSLVEEAYRAAGIDL
ncbi:phosphate/phosphite/phosphonate ABC transporter substrate-binding protein [Ectothiorhodospira marina]|jgi:phosphonate transport system substrate-binding protein|uniref:Phosphonate transport system substrate-binding protein n=1 Tax=Ectothiorhodospira marina TaxID=1396821 RepID=A0A1H7G5Y0_9GAMM|nr:phosphate/phosphite/phosphonate ABC transporter substrate-binding protein [Ectothiorhodospira marina]SEK33484.1 phosphonate transport system substrate-binding protein [Ectothiorhodospira marina]